MPSDPKTANERTKIPPLGDIKITHSKSKISYSISLTIFSKTTWSKLALRHQKQSLRFKKILISQRTTVATSNIKTEINVPIKSRLKLLRVTKRMSKLIGTGKSLKRKKIAKSLLM